MSLPLDDILTAVYDRLSAQLSEEVRYAGAGGAAPDTYVAIQIPTATRDNTLTSDGHTHTLSIRCHTEHATGEAQPLEVMQLASSAKEALDDWTPNIGPDHAALYLSTPSYNDSSYPIDNDRRGLDYILTYTLRTQALT